MRHDRPRPLFSLQGRNALVTGGSRGIGAIAPGAFASTMNRDARKHGNEVAERILAGAAICLASRAGTMDTD